MPNSPTTAWDGHGTMSGVDTRTHPALLDARFATSSVNRTYRGGRNQVRPPLQQKALVFADSDSEQAFRYGNVQGAIGYKDHFKSTQPQLVVAAGEWLLKGRMFADTIEFSTLKQLSTPEYMHAWFVQAEDRLYYQNGVDDPVGWDGKGTPYDIQGGLAASKMPIGTIMAYVQGRIVVFTADNHALVSDFIYGNTLADTRGAEDFTEISQYNDVGALATPAMLDDVTGAIPVPSTPERNAQGELLVLTKKGAYTLEVRGIREDWPFEDIQQIVMVGQGGGSDKSVVAANNDVWFRTSDGAISSYKFERAESNREWGDTNLSREVSDYLELDTARNLQYCSSVLAHNRLITTCAHQVRTNDISGYGHHRYGQGMVALDFDRGSTVNQRPGFAWDGLWTGINPVQLVGLTVDQELRALAISHDEDGQNRVYELMPDGYTGSDMAEGTSKKIVSFYDLPHLFDQRDATQPVVGKRLTGARVEVSDVRGLSNIKLLYRGNYYPCWMDLSDKIAVGHEPEDIDEPTDQKPFYDIIKIGGPEGECESGSTRLTDRASFFSARVEMEGDISVDQLQLIVDASNEEYAPSCTSAERESRFAQLISCPEPNLFDYKIVTAD